MMQYVVAALERIGRRNLASLLLLWLGLASVMLETADAIHGLDTVLLLGMLSAALVCGGVAARTRMRAAKALLFLAPLGVAVAALTLSELRSRTMAVLAALTEFGPYTRRVADATALWRAALELSTAVQVVLLRLWAWGGAAVAGHYAIDPVAVMLASVFCVWCIGTWAAWSVFRREQVAAALGPAAIVPAAILYGVQRYPSSLLALLSTGILLTVLNAHNKRERTWQEARVDYSEEIRVDLAAVTAPLVLAIVITTAVLSSSSWQDFVSVANSLLPRRTPVLVLSPTGDRGSGDPVTASSFELIRVGGLPRRHLIGSGPELSEQVVMNVRVAHAAQNDEPPFYWRSVTYERYTGSGWVSGLLSANTYRANSTLNETVPPYHFELEQDITLAGTGDGILYASGIVQAVSSDAQLAYRSNGDLFGGLTDARAYRVVSFHPLATEAMLREAGSDYPAWIRERYLALPGDVPVRVLALARNLTAVESTPYDRARAIEGYLRTLPYTLQLPPPPLNRDVVDYFLFDLQKGYCDYYASAMVVMARAAGLPARLVVGYAPGTFDVQRAVYVVTAADAHSWAEVYFPGTGWIEFEPTAGRPALERAPSSSLPARHEPAAGAELSTLNVEALAAGSLAVAGGGLLLLSVGAVAAVGLSDWRLRRMTASAAVDLIYRLMLGHALGMGMRPRPGETAHEIVAGLAGQVRQLTGPPWSLEAGVTLEQFQFLADAYGHARYSAGRTVDEGGRELIGIWFRVRGLIWKARWAQIRRRLGALNREGAKAQREATRMQRAQRKAY